MPQPFFPNGERDLRVHVSYRDLRQSESKICYVFVSHRWLRPASGAAGLPDDEEDSKCWLILQALEKLRGPRAPVPEDVDFALWIDWSCLDQDNPHVANELNTTMRSIMECCDLVLTPVVDPDYKNIRFKNPDYNLGAHEEEELPEDGWLEGYRARAWVDYLDRAWCRVEMMLGAAYAVNEHSERATLFRGVLQAAVLQGRRPHVIVGTREAELDMPPCFLKPLMHHIFARYAPEDGTLTDSRDRVPICEMSRLAREHWPPLEPGYVQGFPYVGGKGRGRGKMTYLDGSVYDGEFVDDACDGQGTAVYPDGNVFEGAWKQNTKHGHGLLKFANGDVFEGEFRHGKRHGWGRHVDGDGIYERTWRVGTYVGHTESGKGGVFEGEYLADKRHGIGTYTCSDGSVKMCQFVAGFAEGEGVEWSPDKMTARRLQDGKEADTVGKNLGGLRLSNVESHVDWMATWTFGHQYHTDLGHTDKGLISLEEAMAIAGRLGGTLPAGVVEAAEAVAQNLTAALIRERELADAQHAAGDVAVERIIGFPGAVELDLDSKTLRFLAWATVGAPAALVTGGVVYYEVKILEQAEEGAESEDDCGLGFARCEEPGCKATDGVTWGLRSELLCRWCDKDGHGPAGKEDLVVLLGSGHKDHRHPAGQRHRDSRTASSQISRCKQAEARARGRAGG